MHRTGLQLKPSNRFFITIIGIVVFFIVLRELSQIFIPLVIAYFLFFVFTPLNRYLEQKSFPYWSIILVDVFSLILLSVFFSGIILDSFRRLGQELPEYEQRLNLIIAAKGMDWGFEGAEDFRLSEYLQSAHMSGIAGGLFTSTFSFLGTMTFVLFFFIFILTGYKRIAAAIRHRYLREQEIPLIITYPSREYPVKFRVTAVPQKVTLQKNKAAMLSETFEEITEQMQRYLVGKFLISLISGIIAAVILWLFGVDFYIVWGVITFLLNFIPNIGSIISIILPCLFALVQFESIEYVTLLLIILSVIDLLTGYYIEPKVLGMTLGLNPLVILLSLLLWGYIWGITGVLLSVPITVFIKIILSKSESGTLKFIHDLMKSG